MELAVFSDLIPSLLSRPGLAAIGAMLDTSQGKMEMSKIGLVVKLSANKVDHWAANIADVDGVGVVWDCGRGINRAAPLVNCNMDSVAKQMGRGDECPLAANPRGPAECILS